MKLPDGWKALSAPPGPQTGEDDYHSKYVDPNGEFGAAKVGGAEDSFGNTTDPEVPEGTLPKVPQAPGLQAPLYPNVKKQIEL